ncbi:hypothetical protein ACRAWG_35830 [Methylobacterium sp. P31]
MAKRFRARVLEDLDTHAMTASARGALDEPGRDFRRKAGLNRGILNAGWHRFSAILAYKTEDEAVRS